MKNYQEVTRELMVFERVAWWNPRVRRILKAAPLVVMFLLLNTRSARAACSFNPTPDPTADGSSHSLRHAIQMANASSEDCLIQLQPGTYTLTVQNTSGQDNTAAEGDLDITGRGRTVTIQGQGAGVSIVNGNSIDRVFQVLSGANAVFRKLTIEGGVAQDDGTAGALPGTTESEGGGVLVQDGGHVILSRVWVERNQAIGGNGASAATSQPFNVPAAPGQSAAGGGLFLSAGTVHLNDSKMSGNFAIGGAGGFNTFANFSTLPSGGPGAGGGLFALSGSARLFESMVSGNAATGGRGGTVASGGAGRGGGLYIFAGSAGLFRSTVSGNRATGGLGGPAGNTGEISASGGNGGAAQGAGLFVGAGALSVRQTTVSGNSGSGGRGGSPRATQIEPSGGSSLGAGIFIASGHISLANSTLFANTAKGGLRSCTGCTSGIPGLGGDAAGGGLYLASGSVSLAGDTVASNRALIGFEKINLGLSYGGGIANAGATSLVTNITLIGNNTQNSGNASNGDDVSGAIASSYSLIGQTAGATITDDGGNLFNVDPRLDPHGLRFNGGPTQTVALQSSSPAIDAVPAAHCTNLTSPPDRLTTDQRGMPRPDFAELVCDIGAYESQETFAGQPRAENCHDVSISTLTHQYGNISAAASALHFPNVQLLQAAIRTFCGQ